MEGLSPPVQGLEISRRQFIQGALIGMAGLQSAALAKHLWFQPPDETVAPEQPGDACGLLCLEVPPIADNPSVATTLPEIPATTTTTMAVPSATIAPELPPTTTTIPTVRVLSEPIPDERTALAPPPYVRHVWWDGTEPVRSFIDRHIDKIPMLPQLAAQFGRQFADADQQVAFMQQLAEQMRVTPEGLEAYQRDTSHMNIFAHQLGYNQKSRIDPQVYVPHWTGKRYEDGVDGLFRALDGRGYRVAEFIGRTQLITYALLDDDTRLMAHAAGCNSFSYGVEVETETYGAEFGHPQSPVYDFLPEQMDQVVYSYESFCIRRGLPVDRTTLVSHYALDLLFDRATGNKYNPETGEVTGVDKWDTPQELIYQCLLPHAQALDAVVRPDGA